MKGQDGSAAICDRLFPLQDIQYREFQCRLMPTVPHGRVIGVRTPALRRLAAELAGTPEAEEFLHMLPHVYYEENNLHAFLIERIRDYGAAVAAVDEFLPFVDNWATCDSMSPKVFARHLPELLAKIRVWLESGDTYTVRFAVGMLMSYYLDGGFTPEYPGLVLSVRSDEYYVNMMRAWYFATALAKQYDVVLPVFLDRRLDAWTHNKAIRKAIESRRITQLQKEFLGSLKV